MSRVKRKRYGWIIIPAAALILICAAAVSAVVFEVDTIQYIGDDHYSDEELTDKLFNGKNPNALYYFLIERRKNKEIPFIQKYEVEIRWPSKMLVTIYEKPVIGYVNYMGFNMYFDKDGTAVESSTKILSGIPQISGLKFNEIVLGSRLDVGNADVFGRILELTQSFDKYQLSADKIYFDSAGEVTLTMGNVKVMLGDCDNLLDKLFELKQMMPELEGRSGVLHMENFSGETGGIIFKKNGE